MDRHDANILVAEGVAEDGGRRTRLIPIDHGTILPDSLAVDECDAWAWLDWPQLKQPTHAALRRHILASEPAADTRLLRAQLALRPECVAVSRLAAELLKQGTAAGFNLHPIARMMARPDECCCGHSALPFVVNVAWAFPVINYEAERGEAP